MKKTEEPVKILVIDPTPDKELWNSPEIRKLMDGNDTVKELIVDADVVIGPSAYRVFPKTVSYFIASLSSIRRDKVAKTKKNRSEAKA
jgi:hypothetical protein